MTLINIRVKADSGKQEIKKISDGKFLIKLKSRPENDRANIELIKLLKKYFKKEVNIIKGLRSRNKIIEVKNADKI